MERGARRRPRPIRRSTVCAYIGAFYGRYFFLGERRLRLRSRRSSVSRIVKLLGIGGVLLALPLVAFGAYGLVATGAGLAVIRWAKTAENAVDYSIMNTGKQMLWLATRREEKYKAKQAIDTFFVAPGDLVAASLVYAGTTWAGAGVTTFGAANIALVLVWAGIVWAVVKRYRSLCAGLP